MKLKICGLKSAEQAAAIARLGVTSLGFICVPASPRWIDPEAIGAIARHLERSGVPPVERVGVFANATVDTVVETVNRSHLTTIQLHGDESPQWVAALAKHLPGLPIWKALRVQSAATLAQAEDYAPWVAALLLDAYRPGLLGGTGHTFDWQQLGQWRSPVPWYLAGGLTPENIASAIAQLADNPPTGLDLSSGVERSPGDKDLDRVAAVVRALAAQVSVS